MFSFGRHTKEMGRFQWPFHHHHGDAKIERDVGERPQDGIRVNAVGAFSARLNQEQRTLCTGLQTATLVEQAS